MEQVEPVQSYVKTMIRRIFYALVSLTIVGHATASDSLESPTSRMSHVLARGNVDEINRTSVLRLRSVLGAHRSEKVIRLIAQKYPEFHLIETCEGTFKSKGDLDIGFALLNANLTKVVYGIAFGNEGNRRLLELIEHDVAFNEHGVLPRTPDIRCESWTGIARIAETYRRLSVNSASQANLRPVTKFDAVCVVAFNSVEEYVCYGYSNKRGAVITIGGWYND